jgi:hypothetical protein
MAQIKTWQEAFKNQKLDPNVMPDVSMLPKEMQKPQIALFKLHVVSKELNGDWQPDYTDHNQWKYAPWFKVQATKDKPSGVGLSYCDCVNWYPVTDFGVRLCYKDEQTAQYAGEQFLELWEDLFLNK